MTTPSAPRDVAITFAGGGNRAFYQLGLLHQWGPRLRPRIAAIAACSAGACVATMWLSGRETQTRRFWRARRDGVDRNFQWSRLLRGQRPTPHGPIYRDTLLCAFAEDGLQRIRDVPFPILVVTAAPPPLLPASVGALLGFSAYNLEKRLRRDFVHPVLSQRLGFSPHVVDARRCSTAEELADLIIASSATPPFTTMGRFRGRRLLDGGLVDNAPASAAERVAGVRRNLVLLTGPTRHRALASRARGCTSPPRARSPSRSGTTRGPSSSIRRWRWASARPPCTTDRCGASWSADAGRDGLTTTTPGCSMRRSSPGPRPRPDANHLLSAEHLAQPANSSAWPCGVAASLGGQARMLVAAQQRPMQEASPARQRNAHPGARSRGAARSHAPRPRAAHGSPRTRGSVASNPNPGNTVAPAPPRSVAGRSSRRWRTSPTTCRRSRTFGITSP